MKNGHWLDEFPISKGNLLVLKNHEGFQVGPNVPLSPRPDAISI